MKKNFVFVLTAIALSVGFAACSDEDEKEVPKPGSSIINESKDNSVAQFDTLYLKAGVENMPSVTSYEWTLDGKKVSEATSYKFSQIKTGEYTIGLTVTNADGETVCSEMTAKVFGKFSKGAFVLNEGNMGNETGTLTFVDSEGMAMDSAYYRVNGTLLGNVCQDMFIAGQKLYVISQNGAKNGGEGLLTIAKADDLEKIEVYNTSTLSWPSNIAVVGDDIYIRDGKGVYLLNASTKDLTIVEGSSGALKNRMAVIGDKVFVMGSKKISVIQKGKIVHTINVTGALSGIAKSSDGNLWASCTTPSILKINPSDYSIIDTHNLTTGIGTGGGVAPAFSAKADTLYFCNGSSKLYRHIFKENKTEEVANIKDHLPDANIYYNSLGVDPVSGEVYYATLKGFGANYKINDIGIFDFSKTPALQHNFKSMNSFPAGVYFTENFK